MSDKWHTALQAETAELAMRIYKIKPLEWERTTGGNWSAKTVFGSISVFRKDMNDQWSLLCPFWMRVRTYISAEAAKAAAVRRYKFHLRKALVELINQNSHKEPTTTEETP